jgi:hypothetical protein
MPTVSDSTLDQILALQLTIAWAGEGRCEPRRLGWWDTDLVDEAGGGDLFARLLPRTAPWASLEAVREAARRTDAKARSRMGNPDAVRSLFFLGFDLDEPLNDRLAALKREGKSPAEATEVHTRMLRTALGIEASRAYWEQVDPSVPLADRAILAFEQRWIGAKSLPWIRLLLADFAARYDAFPQALVVLRNWRNMDPSTRQVLCHFHLQLSDPLYRRFTGRFLVERRGMSDPRVDREAVLRWIRNEFPDRWSESTCVQFASKLLGASSEAGLVSPKKDPRKLLLPKVPDLALAYWLYLLREIRFEGTLTDNPYLASVGLDGGFLDQRLRNLPGISFHRMGHLTEFNWAAPNLRSWAEATL